jgi:hypothetical protein
MLPYPLPSFIWIYQKTARFGAFADSREPENGLRHCFQMRPNRHDYVRTTVEQRWRGPGNGNKSHPRACPCPPLGGLATTRCIPMLIRIHRRLFAVKSHFGSNRAGHDPSLAPSLAHRLPPHSSAGVSPAGLGDVPSTRCAGSVTLSRGNLRQSPMGVDTVSATVYAEKSSLNRLGTKPC